MAIFMVMVMVVVVVMWQFNDVTRHAAGYFSSLSHSLVIIIQLPCWSPSTIIKSIYNWLVCLCIVCVVFVL